MVHWIAHWIAHYVAKWIVRKEVKELEEMIRVYNHKYGTTLTRRYHRKTNDWVIS